MHVRCSYCRHSFNLSKEYLLQSLTQAEAERQKYHAVECINCRKVIKVSITQMKRYAPPPEKGEESKESIED